MNVPALPRWRLPVLNFAAGALSWRQLLLGIAAFILAFMLGFRLAFPTVPLKQKLVDSFREHQATAELESLSLAPLLALQGRNLTIRPDNASLPALAVERFSVRPLWLSLLSAEPGLQIDAELLQGTLQAAMHQGGRLQAEARGLHVALPLKNGVATITGTLSVGSLHRATSDGRATEHSLSLNFSELLVQSPLLAGSMSRPLHLGRLILEGSGRGQAFKLTRLESNGGDLALSGTGSLLLGSTLESSRLNLNLALRPTASSPGGLKGLFDLMAPPAGDGTYHLQIVGTLTNPVLQTPGAVQGPTMAPTAQEEDGERGTEPSPASAFDGKHRHTTEPGPDDN